MNKDAKTTYAQSSDIKSRTYLEYRRDMKKKAIAELEITDWLQDKLQQAHPNVLVKVSKSGGDAFLWFLRKGGVTREPDYQADIGDKKCKVEFQYAGSSKLPFFDFAVSKISKRERKTKVLQPHTDRQIVYLLKDKKSFALIEPAWIAKEGKIGFVAAWRKDAYRVPARQFLKIFSPDPLLPELIESIERKNVILQFQHELLNITKEKLAHLLEQVIDEKKLMTLVPDNLESFFRVCFILDNLGKFPRNANLWLVYVLSLINKHMPAEDLYKAIYAVDFLYAKTVLTGNEVELIVDKITCALNRVSSFETQEGWYTSEPNLSPLDATRYALFVINLIEDLMQDLIFYYHVKALQPIKKIYQHITNVKKVSEVIQAHSRLK